jgi:Lrp/AsnC family leucine-responsive transcriptional regulator
MLGARKVDALRARFWHGGAMLDRFDFALLNLLQQDSAQTAEQLAQRVALSPSAIARRLRRLRAQGWLARSVALLSPRLTGRRLRALVLVQLSEHADLKGKAALLERLVGASEVQFCYEITGPNDLLALIDCDSMSAFNAVADRILSADPTVRRYETHFVKREVKFAPFVELSARDSAD